MAIPPVAVAAGLAPGVNWEGWGGSSGIGEAQLPACYTSAGVRTGLASRAIWELSAWKWAVPVASLGERWGNFPRGRPQGVLSQ